MNMYENIHAENEYHKAKNEELARFFGGIESSIRQLWGKLDEVLKNRSKRESNK